jgi:hypothetical protein
MGRLYAPSNRGEHPQHPIQLLLFASGLDIDRKPQSAYDRFIDSSTRGFHEFPTAHPGRSIHRIAEGDDGPCCRPGLVGVCGTRFDSARKPESAASASNVAGRGSRPRPPRTMETTHD